MKGFVLWDCGQVPFGGYGQPSFVRLNTWVYKMKNARRELGAKRLISS